MFALLRRYLRRVDALYLALCAACSVVSVVVLVSIGQTQLGSNNKASVQLIASFLGIMLAVIFSTVDYRALARAWPPLYPRGSRFPGRAGCAALPAAVPRYRVRSVPSPAWQALPSKRYYKLYRILCGFARV